MKVLLIEDEQHKANDLRSRILNKGFLEASLTLVNGVKQAVLHVENESFDLIILDMALPTFSGETAGGGGVAQAVGGIEVLRSLQLQRKMTNIIIVTQYPEVVIGGKQVKLHHAARVASTKYQQNVLGVVLYSYKTAGWEKAFDALLGKVK